MIRDVRQSGRDRITCRGLHPVSGIALTDTPWLVLKPGDTRGRAGDWGQRPDRSSRERPSVVRADSSGTAAGGNEVNLMPRPPQRYTDEEKPAWRLCSPLATRFRLASSIIPYEMRTPHAICPRCRAHFASLRSPATRAAPRSFHSMLDRHVYARSDTGANRFCNVPRRVKRRRQAHRLVDACRRAFSGYLSAHVKAARGLHGRPRALPGDPWRTSWLGFRS
jgi:hypothetical protein